MRLGENNDRTRKNPIQFAFRKDFKEKLQNTPVNWGYGGLSEFTYYRTYARKTA